MQKTKLSNKAFLASKKLFPGGVNSPVRAFKNVNSLPVFIKKGDVEENFNLTPLQYKVSL